MLCLLNAVTYLCQGSLLVAEVMASEGYRVKPLPRVKRHDIIQVWNPDSSSVSDDIKHVNSG